MKQYLKSYRMVLRTQGPVFVGNGRKIGKKESVWMSPVRLGIPDIERLYGEMVRRKKGEDFEKYLLEDKYLSLADWFRKQNIRLDDIRPYIKYGLDCGDPLRETGKQKQVMECVKDAYGNPYIPGSTLKGMFRTILLGADMMENPEKYKTIREKMKRSIEEGCRNVRINREMEETERIFYRVLEVDRDDPGGAVNDMLRGLIVSDSEPLSVKQLTLCQKIDLHVNGTEKPFPILRECIRSALI